MIGERPPILHGRTERVRTGRGKVYITVNRDTDGHVAEVFVTHGKAGGNNAAMAEALSRSITLGLQSGASPSDFVEQLSEIIDIPVYEDGRRISSVPDAVAKVIHRSLEHSTEKEGAYTQLED